MKSNTVVKSRESSVELLKIIAMFLIVIAHVVQSALNLHLDEFPLDRATTDIHRFIMAFLIHFGSLGNYIFIICSIWFLIGKEKDHKKKILQLILDSFMISVGILSVSVISGVSVSSEEFIRSFFPITFANNWFVTCYILFLLAIPYLNIILNHITKKELLSTNIVFIVLYWLISFIKSSFFVSEIIMFVTLYFIVAYIKKYMTNFQKSVKMNLICLFIGLGGFIFLLCITNFLGLKIAFFNDKLLCWANYINPFFLLVAIALFNLFKNLSFTSKAINTVSSVSLFVYLLHENIIVKSHLRTALWLRIIDKFSLDYILIEEFVYASALFAVSLLIGLLYKFTINKILTVLTDKIYNSKRIREVQRKLYSKIEHNEE